MERGTIAGLEWPTLVVAAAIYGGFGLLTWHYHALPAWIVVPLAAYLVAWHGSLQHEAVHGHPTRSRALNEALVYPSLWLWLPFRLYRDLHVRHHAAPVLTDPVDDPESFYLARGAWQGAGGLRRAVLTANNSALGRLLLGPFLIAGGFLASEVRRVAAGDLGHARAWLHHGAGVALVLGWVVGVCGIGVLEYAACFALPGVSLTLLRGFAEHRASADPRARTAVIEAGPLMALVYLNNNLHVVHHDEPALAWFALPGRWRERREAMLGDSASEVYPGYAEVVARHALRAREPVPWPLG